VSQRSVERSVSWLREQGKLVFLRNVIVAGSKNWTRAYTVCVKGNAKEVHEPCTSLEGERPAKLWRIDNQERPAKSCINDPPNRLNDPPSFGVQVPSRVPTKDSSKAKANTAISPCGGKESDPNPSPKAKPPQLEGKAHIPRLKGKSIPRPKTDEEWQSEWRRIQALKARPSSATVGMYRACKQCGGAIGYCGH